ncbi:ABC transporter permease [Flavobacterium sp. LS1R49]|uniref:ABC transporter permease n=1 Tax=Flavobacterium shii TaxID=2987687 RepID=A0A9X3C6Q7_9FLAO|nr:ABC transporter permease [Flavobacterium shii]MCV9927028.1 ABC transporter permease [Flavobacterium shii]
MKIANLFLIALKALRRNKLRALLTMLGIIIGVASVIAMVAIGQGSKKSIQDQLASMGSNMITIRPNSNIAAGARLDFSNVQTLTLSDVDALKKESIHLNAISPAVSSKGQAINGSLNWPTTMQGVSLDYLKIRDWPLKEGIAFRESDTHTANKVCLIGQTVVDNIFPYGVNPIGQIIRFNKIPFRVIGVLESKGENAFGQDQDDIIISPFTTVQKRITNSIYLQNIYASTANASETELATAEIETIMRTAHRLKPKDEDDFTVRTQAELINTFSSTSQLLTVLLTAISGISLLIGGIGIMNIMYVSVTERTKEIGLRMSIGANGRDILLQFLVEAILISLTGGLIGIVLGIIASELIQYFLHWPTLISESSVILSFLVCAITGIFFGYYPALKASKLDPIEALHFE